MPVESYEDDDEEQEGPRSSFGTYLAEGDALFKQSEYKKALESYSLALELQPNDKTCLVARSKCYLKLGDPQKALQDAEDALTEDKEFNKGLYRKAEALYCMGDFEYALMYYHRGHKLRPELDEFRLGIQKAQEAIDNSIGSAAKIKLENKGDLSFFTKQDDIGNKKRAGYLKPTTTKKLKPLANRNKEVKPLAPSKKTVKQLLGELYSDKEYFEKLMEDEAFIKSRQNNPIYELVQGGLNYLETRTEFWRQQKPLYARKKEKAKYNVVRKKAKPSISKYVLKQLEEIDQALSSGDPDRSLRLAQKLLKSVEGMNKDDLPNKAEVISNIHSCIGNAYIEMDQLTKALRHHDKDLQLSRQSKLVDGESRALDNVGRVHARMGNFKKAVESWNLKLPLVKASLESTWLCHEIGRCHLELGNNQSAKEFGKKSLSAGKDCEDKVWQLNATVLIAQSEVKLREVDDAIETFSNALELAIGLGDSSAQAAISKALSELQRRSSQSRDSQGRTSQASAQYLSQSDDEGSPRIKSDMDDKRSDADASRSGSRSSERSNVEEGGEDVSTEEKTGDEIESDAIYESNQDEDTTDVGHDDSIVPIASDNNVPDGDKIEHTGVADVPPTIDERTDNENKEEKPADADTSYSESFDDVTPRASSADDVTPRNEGEVVSPRENEEDSVPKSGSDVEPSAGNEGGVVEEGSRGESEVTQDIEENKEDSVPKSGSDGETIPENEGMVEDGPRDESEATQSIGEKEDGVPKSGSDDENVNDGPLDESDVAKEAEEGQTHVSTNAVLTYGDLDRQSSAEQLSVDPSYSEDVDGTLSTDDSTENVHPVVSESIDNVETPDVSAEQLTSPIPSVVTDVGVIPDDSAETVGEEVGEIIETQSSENVTSPAASTEHVIETTENVISEATLPTMSSVESTEEVSSLNETTENVSPTASATETKDETPLDASEASNADELPIDSSRGTPEDTPRDYTSVTETISGNDDSTQAQEVSSIADIPADSSQATLVSTTDEIPRDASDASLSPSEEIPRDLSENTKEVTTADEETSQDSEKTTGEVTVSQDESSSKETGDESVTQSVTQSEELGKESEDPAKKETSQEEANTDDVSPFHHM